MNARSIEFQARKWIYPGRHRREFLPSIPLCFLRFVCQNWSGRNFILTSIPSLVFSSFQCLFCFSRQADCSVLLFFFPLSRIATTSLRVAARANAGCSLPSRHKRRRAPVWVEMCWPIPSPGSVSKEPGTCFAYDPIGSPYLCARTGNRHRSTKVSQVNVPS